MSLKSLARSWLIDILAQRDDRYYWRQPHDARPLPPNARLLLWQPDGKLGDAIINARFVHDIATQRPDVQIHVACGSGLMPFWSALPGVHAVHDASAGVQRQALIQAMRGCEAFISFEAFLSLDTVRLLRAIQPQRSIGFSVGRYRLFDDAVVDTTYEFPRRHVSARLRHLNEILTLQHLEHSDVAATVRQLPTGRAVLSPHEGPTVFVNTYAASVDRSLSPASVETLLELLRKVAPDTRAVVSLPLGKTLASLGIKATLATEVVPADLSVWELLKLIDQCDAVLTPDTAIGHAAAALDKPVLVFYRDKHYNPVVWTPIGNQVRCALPSLSGDINSFDRQDATTAFQAWR